MQYSECESLEKRLPSLGHQVSGCLLVAFVDWSNVRLELSARPDHELKFSFLCNCQLSVEFGQFFSPWLNCCEYFFMRYDWKLHAGDNCLQGCGDYRCKGAANDDVGYFGGYSEFDLGLDFGSGEEEGVGDGLLGSLEEVWEVFHLVFERIFLGWS